MSEHFDVQWGDPTLYDLTVNTERVPVSTCVDMVVALSKSKEFTETPASKQNLLNLALAARVRAAMRSNESTAAVDVTVEVDDGQVTLSGIVSDMRERDECERVVSRVTGVSTVKDQLNVMRGSVGARIFPSGLAR
jgi:hypothetical protein